MVPSAYCWSVETWRRSNSSQHVNMSPIIFIPGSHVLPPQWLCRLENMKPMLVSAHSTTTSTKTLPGVHARPDQSTNPRLESDIKPCNPSKMRRGRTPTQPLGFAKSAVSQLCTCNIAQYTRDVTQTVNAPLYTHQTLECNYLPRQGQPSRLQLSYFSSSGLRAWYVIRVCEARQSPYLLLHASVRVLYTYSL